MKIDFSRQILGKKNPQIPYFIKIRPVRANLFHTDRHCLLSVAVYSIFVFVREMNRVFCAVEISLYISYLNFWHEILKYLRK